MEQLLTFISQLSGACSIGSPRCGMFLASIPPPPGGVTDRIHTLLRRFLWGGRLCPVAWKTVCLPKSEGGLSFRNLTAWNKALLSKFIWNIQAKVDSLWVKWMHSEILNSREFWTTQTEARDPSLLRSLFPNPGRNSQGLFR